MGRLGAQRAARRALQQSDRLWGPRRALRRRQTAQRGAAAGARDDSAVGGGEGEAVERGVRERDGGEAAGVRGDEEPERVRAVSLAEREVGEGRKGDGG